MANEKRLIDANALFDDLLKRQYSEQTMGIVASYYPQMRAIVANAPTVDAVPVVHGRWIWSEENECDVCSNCGMASLNNYRGNPVPSAYCPNCGADMRERSEWE